MKRESKLYSLKRQKSLTQIFEHNRPFWRRAFYHWEKTFTNLIGLGGESTANQARLIIDGDESISCMLNAIENAQEIVWLETYIFEADTVGHLFRDALIRAANRHVEVLLVYDYVGSSNLPSSFFSGLVEAHGRVIPFNPIWLWNRHGPLLQRDHRKILITDFQLGYCGGLNISADYAGKQHGNGRYRDTVVELKGPSVLDLAGIVADSVRESTGEIIKIECEPVMYEENVFVQVLQSNSHRDVRKIQKSIRMTINRAHKYCHLTSPYFLPHRRVGRALLRAAKRGVDVQVITAGLSDVPIMRCASQHIYIKYLKAGVRIYEMFGKTIHAKTGAIDGVYGWVGSYNLEYWSDRRNLEVNVGVIDQRLTGELEQHFQHDLQMCRELTLENMKGRTMWMRLRSWIAYLMATL